MIRTTETPALASKRRSPLLHRHRVDVEASPLGSRDSHQSLAARALVDQAKRFLMAEASLSEPEAFRRIQKASMDTRTPMTEIARALLIASTVRGSAVRS